MIGDNDLGNTPPKDPSEQGGEPLTLATKTPLKKMAQGQVVQSFSHGRSKPVAVEVKRRRLVVPSGHGKNGSGDGHTSRLTTAEKDTRIKVLKDAMEASAREAEREAQLALEREAARKRQVEEDRLKAEALRIAQAEAAAQALAAAALNPPAAPLMPALAEGIGPRKEAKKAGDEHRAYAPARARDDDEDEAAKEQVKRRITRAASGQRTGGHRDETRHNLARSFASTSSDSDDAASGRRSRSGGGGHRRKSKHTPQVTLAAKVLREVLIPPTITVQDLAIRMAEKGADVVRALMKMGVMVTLPQTIDADTAELVVTEMGHTPLRVTDEDLEIGMKGEEDLPEELQPRPPVVTIMGHVDHGKTSLLDALRSTDVAAGEAGGITQHIGAYQVVLPSGGKITFIDTPGHAAFTEMRARGASVTDIVVLVVAADDGVKEQTIEAIRHAKAAGVPLIVAINKMDKHGANPDHVRQMLLNHEIVVESLGGDVQDVPLSAKTGMGLKELEDAILVQAEILALKANPNRLASGIVIEAKMEKGRGPVATVLIQNGTLRLGDVFVAGAQWGRVRALLNERGQKVDQAIPAEPVEILGFMGAPEAGDDLIIMKDESLARDIADQREKKKREMTLAARAPGLTLENFFAHHQAAGKMKELPLILKADVQGSLEAIQVSLQKIIHEEVSVRILYSGIGAITESDVNLARASGALIVGFNVRANAQAREISKRDNVEIRYYAIIYNLLDEIKASLSGLLSPEVRENFIGHASIRQVFNITKVGRIAGCYVTDGFVKRGARVRLLRDHVVIHEGPLRTLKRLKDEVREVREGYECGIMLENYQDLREGDVIECFELESIQRSL